MGVSKSQLELGLSSPGAYRLIVRNTFLDIEAWQIQPCSWLSFCLPSTPNQKVWSTFINLDKKKDFCLTLFPDSSERGWHGHSMLPILPSVVSCSIKRDGDQFKGWIGSRYFVWCFFDQLKVQECCQDGPHGCPCLGLIFLLAVAIGRTRPGRRWRVATSGWPTCPELTQAENHHGFSHVTYRHVQMRKTWDSHRISPICVIDNI